MESRNSPEIPPKFALRAGDPLLAARSAARISPNAAASRWLPGGG
jgi:hypothetical protein